jgi:hypothetical protein
VTDNRRRQAVSANTVVEGFLVPDGFLAITAQVFDYPAVTLMIEAYKLDTMMTVLQDFRSLDHAEVARRVAKKIIDCKGKLPPVSYEIGNLLMYVIFYHPDYGEHLRTYIPQCLARDNRCHITWEANAEKSVVSVPNIGRVSKDQ